GGDQGHKGPDDDSRRRDKISEKVISSFIFPVSDKNKDRKAYYTFIFKIAKAEVEGQECILFQILLLQTMNPSNFLESA
ncbi:hypothetical protein DRO56_03070, partial [Candidatus Bathyarchaeota archaeon]